MTLDERLRPSVTEKIGKSPKLRLPLRPCQVANCCATPSPWPSDIVEQAAVVSLSTIGWVSLEAAEPIEKTPSLIPPIADFAVAARRSALNR